MLSHDAMRCDAMGWLDGEKRIALTPRISERRHWRAGDVPSLR